MPQLLDLFGMKESGSADFPSSQEGTTEIRAVITGTLNQMQPFSLFCFCVDDEQHRINMFPLIALVSTYI